MSSDLGRAKLTVTAVEQLYRQPSVPILILTGHKDPENIAHFATPRTTVLSKMFSKEELVSTVARLMPQPSP